MSINQANFNTEKIEFSEVRGNLRSNDCLFDITFDLSIKNDEKNHVRVWNYSLILSSIAMVEIYLTLKLIYSVSENTTLGSNVYLNYPRFPLSQSVLISFGTLSSALYIFSSLLPMM